MAEVMVYKPKDIQQILGLSQTKAYELFWSKEFPSFQIGKAHRVLKKDFDKWLDKQVSQRR